MMKTIAFLLIIAVAQAGTLASAADVTSETWKPPIGIPVPSFGIEETYRMYDEESVRNPDLVYKESGSGGYYTHYVDSTALNSTDSGNTYGNPSKPRKTIPLNPPAGSVIEIHGGAEANHAGQCKIHGSGSFDMPIFIRGVDLPEINKGILVGYNYNTKHVIIEGLKSSSITIYGRYTGDFNNCYISVRNCDFKSMSAGNTQNSAIIHNVVFYNNEVHDGGDWTDYQHDEDSGGIGISSRTCYVWVVDNLIYHNQMCAVQVYAYPQNQPPSDPITPHHIYIGRNIAYENQQSAFWSKTARDVIFSQNIAYNHKQDTTYGVKNSGFGSQYDPQRVWFLFNTSYNNHYGFRFAADQLRLRDELYIIGNLIYDCYGRSAGGVEGYGDGIYNNGASGLNIKPMIILNTIYNCANGISNAYHINQTSFIAVNNIFGNCNHTYYNDDLERTVGNRYIWLQQPGTAANCEFDYNLLYNSGGIRWNSDYTTLAAFQARTNEGENCITTDPLFIEPQNGDFRLSPESPIHNMETSIKVQSAFDRFLELYSIDLTEDIEGIERTAAPPIVPNTEDTSDINPSDSTNVDVAEEQTAISNTADTNNTSSSDSTTSDSEETQTNTTNNVEARESDQSESQEQAEVTKNEDPGSPANTKSSHEEQEKENSKADTGNSKKKIITVFKGRKIRMRKIFEKTQELYNWEKNDRSDQEELYE
jgi:hypothetical protein